MGARKRNPSFIPLAKKVLIYLGREKPAVTVDTLVTKLSSLNTNLNSNKKIYEYVSPLLHMLLF